jgi:hypothetical protein
MDRRQSLKLIATGAVAVPAVIAGCKTDDKKTDKPAGNNFGLDRNAQELEYEKINNGFWIRSGCRRSRCRRYVL